MQQRNYSRGAVEEYGEARGKENKDCKREGKGS
jgi:hypothetical protein